MLTSADFAELERGAEPLTTKNHHRFLSEVLACLRRTCDPVAVFELLARMAGRPDESDALHDVRRWYEQLLARPGRLDLAGIELRIAWTRRIARIHESAARHRQQQGPLRPPTRDIRPAMTLEAPLRTLRQKYPVPPPPPPRPRPPQLDDPAGSNTLPTSAGEPSPPPLPQTLAVLFMDQREAVKALKAALTNATGPGKRPPRPIPLVPAAGKFPAELGAVVLDPTGAADRITAYLQALTKKHHGAAFAFFVTDLARDGDRVIARTLLLSAPE